ncbi:MAG: M24 family metallopeptidase, partial [Candidatus Margulisbacteria bacterium]|nr:M24 family metallopeptidase [Candidatus Margulisiibacteriota bacterium]
MNPAQQKAIGIACEVMRSLCIKAGQTEAEIADWIKHEISLRNAKPSFELIVASGKRSVDPHARPSHKRVRNGEQVVVDLGARYKGYCSDLT